MPFDEEINVEISRMPELENPILICGFPGSGFVGKLAVDYLISTFKGIKFAEIFSTSFPPQVTIQEDGTVDLIKNTLYYCKNSKNDLVFLTGDAQPVSAQGEYSLSEKILEICKELNIRVIYSLAAYITGKFSKSQNVFGTGTSKEIIKDFSQFGISTMNRGNITGMNGVLIGIAKKFSIGGICLLGETSGYVIDATASKAVLEALSKLTGISIDMSELNQKAIDTERVIKIIQSQAASQSELNQPIGSPSKDEKNIDYIS